MGFLLRWKNIVLLSIAATFSCCDPSIAQDWEPSNTWFINSTKIGSGLVEYGEKFAPSSLQWEAGGKLIGGLGTILEVGNAPAREEHGESRAAILADTMASALVGFRIQKATQVLPVIARCRTTATTMVICLAGAGALATAAYFSEKKSGKLAEDAVNRISQKHSKVGQPDRDAKPVCGTMEHYEETAGMLDCIPSEAAENVGNSPSSIDKKVRGWRLAPAYNAGLTQEQLQACSVFPTLKSFLNGSANEQCRVLKEEETDTRYILAGACPVYGSFEIIGNSPYSMQVTKAGNYVEVIIDFAGGNYHTQSIYEPCDP